VNVKLKPIAEQVVVLMGASSGIGRVTAREFAKRGAKVVVASRSEEGLQSIVEEIKSAGGDAISFVADTTDEAQVLGLADYAVAQYGRIDTWVQLAGIGIVSEYDKITSDDFRKLLDINLVGMFHGVKVAVEKMRDAGGAFIGISSVEGSVSFPLQSAYAASKHGVVGLLDGVRVELIHDKIPVSITNIAPAAIDTPFFDRAKAKVGVEPKAPPPVYSPESVARAILYAAEHPVRDLSVGSSGGLIRLLSAHLPGLTDKLMAKTQYKPQLSDKPKSQDAESGLETGELGMNQDTGGYGGRPSIYTWIQTNPKTALTIAAAAVGATAAIVYEVVNSKEKSTYNGFAGRIKNYANDLDLEGYRDSATDALSRVIESARSVIASLTK
jgi:NAD(P)-dependent dehydrogenase (short-subunit alcohol dehydrogenase family)